MSKLVLLLLDGTTLEVPLAMERTTIGRRADNDICLPNLAVSGEHAVVVTILADSFLEDLGSTNGTLVNGNAIAKYFLRDRDQIDIGRHRLVYCVDDDAVIGSEVVAGMARINVRGVPLQLAEILVDKGNRHAAYTDARGDALDRAVANIADRENTGHAGFQQIGVTLERP